MGLLSSPMGGGGARVNNMVDEVDLETLVERAANGDSAAWRAMWEDVEPWLIKVVGNPRFLGRLGQRQDDRSNIVVEVMARLHSDGFHRLKLYVDTRRSSPQLRFKTWSLKQGMRINVHPHVLRHSFASHVLQSSSDLRAVQEMLGHASIASTQVYTHLDFQHLAKVYDAAHPRAKRR